MTDGPPPEDFDYGEKLDDGQYEKHPTKDDGEFVQPVREKYIHKACGEATTMRTDIAESVARDPTQYSKTFCANCEEYVVVSNVKWKEDGKAWDMRDSQ